MPQEALRKILPIAGWPERTGRCDLHRRHRSRAADAVSHRRGGGGDRGGGRARRRPAVGGAQRAAAAVSRSTCARPRRRCAAAHYMKLGDGASVAQRATASWAAIRTRDGRWSYLHCNFPNHRAAALGVLGVAEDRAAVAARWPNGTPPTSRRRSSPPRAPAAWCARRPNGSSHPQAAAIAALPLMEIVRIGDSPPEPLPEGRPAAVRHPRARSHARAGGADLRAHPGRAWRRRDEDHRRPSAQPRLPGMGHRARQALGPARSARSRAISRPCAGWCAQADVFSQGYRPGSLGGRGLVARGAGRAAAGPRLCLALGLRPCRAVGGAARLRHRGADRERHDRPPGRDRAGQDGGPAILSGVGDRLLHRLPDGVRRDGGAGAPRAAKAAAGWCASRSPRSASGWSISARCRPLRSKEVPAEFSADELESWSMVSETPSGPLRHLKPVVQMSETPPIGRGRRCRSAIIARCGRPAARREGEFPHFPEFPLPVLARRKTLVAETLVAGGRCAKKVERWA